MQTKYFFNDTYLKEKSMPNYTEMTYIKKVEFLVRTCKALGITLEVQGSFEQFSGLTLIITIIYLISMYYRTAKNK